MPLGTTLTHQFERAVRLLDERCHVYQYLIKRTVDPFTAGPCVHPVAREAIVRRTTFLNERRDNFYRLDLDLVLLYERTGGTPHEHALATCVAVARRGVAGLALARSNHEEEIDRSIATLHHKAHAFEVHLDAFRPERLAKADAFRFLRQLVNYDEHIISASPLISEF